MGDPGVGRASWSCSILASTCTDLAAGRSRLLAMRGAARAKRDMLVTVGSACNWTKCNEATPMLEDTATSPADRFLRSFCFLRKHTAAAGSKGEMDVVEVGADGSFDIASSAGAPANGKQQRESGAEKGQEGDSFAVFKCEDALTHQRICECRIVFRSAEDMPSSVDLQQDSVVYQHRKLGCRRIELPKVDIQSATVHRSEEKKTIFVRANLEE